ncbi:MAG: short-chain dehydrogenase/reductase [Chloroflexi bacterium]|nr:short-chain dehydrogenase/reductase [Chloroflexota bacterium]
MRLDGKVAICTGADNDIGRAIAVRLASEGARIVAVSPDPQKAQDTVAAIEKAGGTTSVVGGDFSQEADAERIVGTAVDKFGRVDVLVNYGANRRIVGTIMDVTDSDFEEELRVDLKGAIGSIINLSSVASFGVKGRALRSLTKAAVNSLTAAMAQDHGADKIRVNAVSIGPTWNPDMERNAQQFELMKSESALKELHTPESHPR